MTESRDLETKPSRRQAAAERVSRLGVLCAVLWAVAGSASTYAQGGQAQGVRSAEETAAALANPNASVGFLAFPLDFVAYDGERPDAGDQHAWKLAFQPSLPKSLGAGKNFFVRPLIPVIFSQPVTVDGGFESKGVDLGDISFDAALGKGFSNGIQVIGGTVGAFPTATDDLLGSHQYLLGPEFFLGVAKKWGFIGGLFSQQWDIAGPDDRSTNVTGGQYFYTINLKNAWQIQAQPTWSYNHDAPSGSRLTFPVGVGVSKTIIAGTMPWKFSLQYWHYVERPEAFGPRYQIRFQVAPVVPLPW